MKKIYKNIDQFTFGSSPAAIYLAHLLNQKQNSYLNKKISSTLVEHNKALSEIEEAYNKKIISLKTLQKFLFLQRNNIDFDCDDKKIKNVVENLLVSKIKPLLRKSKDLVNIDTLQKKAKHKVIKKEISADIKYQEFPIFSLEENKIIDLQYNLDDIEDVISNETLTKKWKKRMERKNLKF